MEMLCIVQVNFDSKFFNKISKVDLQVKNYQFCDKMEIQGEITGLISPIGGKQHCPVNNSCTRMIPLSSA